MSEEQYSEAGKATVLSPNLVDLLGRIFGVAAGIMLFLLMIVVCVDVVGRYVFSSPLRGGFEYIRICMAFVVFLALPVVVARQENVEVEIFQVLIPKPVRHLSRMLGFLVSFMAATGFTYVCFLRASSFQASGERFTLLPVQLYPFAYFIFAIWAVCVAIMIAQLFGFWRFIKSSEGER